MATLRPTEGDSAQNGKPEKSRVRWSFLSRYFYCHPDSSSKRFECEIVNCHACRVGLCSSHDHSDAEIQEAGSRPFCPQELHCLWEKQVLCN